MIAIFINKPKFKKLIYDQMIFIVLTFFFLKLIQGLLLKQSQFFQLLPLLIGI